MTVYAKTYSPNPITNSNPLFSVSDTFGLFSVFSVRVSFMARSDTRCPHCTDQAAFRRTKDGEGGTGHKRWSHVNNIRAVMCYLSPDTWQLEY